MANSGLHKSYIAVAAIAAFRICKFGATEGEVQLAAAATDKLIGVTGAVPARAAGEVVDLIHGGIVDIEAGAAFAAGDAITSDAVGRAIVAAPAAGVNNRIIGEALGPALAAGDIVPVLFAPSVMQGA